MIGVNLSGAEFGDSSYGVPQTYNKVYAYPGDKDINFHKAQGVKLIRLPFKWERMQPDLKKGVDPIELERMKIFLSKANAAGMKVVIDCHNYGRRYGKVIGSSALATSSFTTFWKHLATALKGTPGLLGYGIMNEPHGMSPNEHWNSIAQKTVNTIRTVDKDTIIYVGGNDWSGAWNWEQKNPGFPVKDPSNKVVYEAHIYFDKYNTGTYQNTFDADNAGVNHGVARLRHFVAWLKKHNVKGFIGEFNVPDTDPRWIPLLDVCIAEMNAAGVDGTLWGGGSWWNSTYSMRLMETTGLPSVPFKMVVDKYIKPVA